jgi:GNAT superfamily N-acetyltransferase
VNVAVRGVNRDDVSLVADLIEEIERFYGAGEVQPLAERVAQTEAALFGDPPLATAVLAVDDTGAVHGFAAYSFLWPAAGSTHSLFLKELYVRESARRAGVASRLIDHLRTVAADRPGCTRVEWVTDRDNASARAFYRALGVPEFGGKVFYRLDGDALRP